MKTPDAALAIAYAMRKGQSIPKGVTVEPGTYEPSQSIWGRLINRIRPKRGCGCKARKVRLNKWIPGLGDRVELITKYTGIKWAVDRLHQ